MCLKSKYRHITSFTVFALVFIGNMLGCSVCATDLSDTNFKQAGNFITALEHAEQQSLQTKIDDVEAKIQDKLEEFSNTKDVNTLEDAYSLVKSLYRNRGKENWDEIRKRVLILRLKILDECYEARDQTYSLDRDKRPVIHPPVLLSPEEKEDPQAKKQYDRKMEEYQKHIHKLRQELLIQRIYDRIVRDLEVHLESVGNNPKLNVDKEIEIIKRSITNDNLKEKFVNQAHTPFTSAKKRKIFEAFKNAKGEDRYKKGVAVAKMLRKHVDEFRSRRESNENRLLTKQEIASFLGRPGKQSPINSNRKLYSYDLNPKSPLIDTALLIIEFEDNEIINVSIAKTTD